MKKSFLLRVSIWSILGWATLRVFLGPPLFTEDEPKSVSEALILVGTYRGPQEHDQALKAICQMGPRALPALGRILRRHTSPIERVRARLVRLGLARPPQFSLRDQHLCALRAACILAENGNVDIAVLIPELVYHLTNSASHESAMALVRAGPAGVSILTNLLANSTNSYASARGRAAYALGLVRTNVGVRDVLKRAAVSDLDHNNRDIAAGMLLQRGATNPEAFIALSYLRSGDKYLLLSATNTLQKLGAPERDEVWAVLKEIGGR